MYSYVPDLDVSHNNFKVHDSYFVFLKEAEFVSPKSDFCHNLADSDFPVENLPAEVK